MLGVFDSGYGGLTVLRAIRERFPELSTFYLGDNVRAPYGTRTQEEIFQYTLDGVRFLFSEGCPLVVIACNTASASALRRIQQEVLPREFPERRVLGVIRPSAEEAVRMTRNGHIGVIGTVATVSSGAYSRECAHLRPEIAISEVAAPSLAGLIEEGRERSAEVEKEVRGVFVALGERDERIDTVILACTHFPLAMALFEKHRPAGVRFLPQAPIVAEKLADYLVRHPEIAERLEKTSHRLYATTAEPHAVSERATWFYGAPLLFVRVSL